MHVHEFGFERQTGAMAAVPAGKDATAFTEKHAKKGDGKRRVKRHTDNRRNKVRVTLGKSF